MAGKEERSLSLSEALAAAAKDGRIACPVALKIAARLGASAREAGEACNRLGLKIVDCQLGCFGRSRSRRGREEPA